MDLEKKPKRPPFSLRDWLLSMAGFLVIIAALLKRISVSDALSMLSGLK